MAVRFALIFFVTYLCFMPPPAGAAELVVGDTPGEVFIIEAGTQIVQDDLLRIVNDGRLEIRGSLTLSGNMLVTDQGAAIIDGGELHLQGDYRSITVAKSGRLEVLNNGFLHFAISYVNQQALFGMDSAVIKLTDARVSYSRSSGAILLSDNAVYEGTRVEDPDWKTWYIGGQSVLRLTDYNMGGDIVFGDGPTMEFTNVVGVMPWLHFPSGTALDYQFPKNGVLDPATVTLNAQTPGFSGIAWSIAMKNCRAVAWGVNPYPGSNVTVRNSYLSMVMFKYTGPGRSALDGIMVNNSEYADMTAPVADRTFRLVNTKVRWWKVDVIQGHELHASNLRFSEMVAKENSKSFVKNSVCEGQTIHLGAFEDSFIEFENGEIWSYVATWNKAFMVLRDSSVDYRKAEYRYQNRNIAHNGSRLYCLNTTFGYVSDPQESEPEAFDTALVLFALIKPVQEVTAGQSVEVRGSAWIKAGERSPVKFERYQLSFASQKDPANWQEITGAVAPVKDGVLGIWNTAGLDEGAYQLRLTISVAGDAPSAYPPSNYPALRMVAVKRDPPPAVPGNLRTAP